jgi:peroxiredoxin
MLKTANSPTHVPFRRGGYLLLLRCFRALFWHSGLRLLCAWRAKRTFLSCPVTILCCVAGLVLSQIPSVARAQQATEPQKTDDKTAIPPVSDWPKLEIPTDNADGKLESFIASAKKLQPRSAEQYIEMQRSIRSAAKLLVELTTDRSSPVLKQAEADFVSASVMLLGNEGPDAQVKTFERFRDYLADKKKIAFADIQMAFLAGQNLEQIADVSLAKKAYESFAEIFKQKDDPALADIVATLEANVRRLDLPGKLFKLQSNTLDGAKFELEAQRGKYVLIYFWSSASPPCEQEFPYMRSVYEKYKSRGFEIVGVGMDEKKDAAIQFVKRLEVPWINVWDNRKDGVAKVMQNYGISALPTLILLDKELKVITLEARGLLLGKALENLLPDPKPEEPNPDDPKPDDPKPK